MKHVETVARALAEVRDKVDDKQILKHLLKELYSLVTDYPNKYGIRYRSKAVVNGGNPVIHEHVVPRNWITDSILHTGSVEAMRGLLVACLVTEDEHRRLHRAETSRPEEPSLELGWERYRTLVPPIDVYDMAGASGAGDRPEWIESFEGAEHVRD